MKNIAFLVYFCNPAKRLFSAEIMGLKADPFQGLLAISSNGPKKKDPGFCFVGFIEFNFAKLIPD